MQHILGAVIASIRKGSVADELGLHKGDILLAVSGHKLRDYIDYRYFIATDFLSLRVHRPGQDDVLLEVDKDPDEDLGIRFTSDVFDRVRLCRCRCEFCFVAQLPRGLRPALYLRDDDYRLSFLHGNFITLGNLSETDFQRILQFHLSPLYVSVHATEPDVRAKLMGSPVRADRQSPEGSARLPEILPLLRRLTDGGIEIHAQIVLCAGRNDGAHLARTVRDLADLSPGIRSIGIVPVGTTNAVPERASLRLAGSAEAQAVLQSVAEWQQTFLMRLGTRLVYASDELYLQARRDFPPAEEYEDLAQLANGIGDARLFLDEIESPEMTRVLEPKGRCRAESPALQQSPRVLQPETGPLRIILGTGTGASGLVAQLAARFTSAGIDATVVVAANRFFGPDVTTAGLITGADWLQALHLAPPADLIILPRQTINADGRFLDDMTRRTIAKRLATPVRFAKTPLEAAKEVSRFARQSSRTVAIEPS
jgi:putative radical SAM enzyme (TIGR03279 family)